MVTRSIDSLLKIFQSREKSEFVLKLFYKSQTQTLLLNLKPEEINNYILSQFHEYKNC